MTSVPAAPSVPAGPFGPAAPARPAEVRADVGAHVVVVGSGAAGLSAALAAAASGRRVLVVTKGRLVAGSTAWAQGGIAAAVAAGDSVADHVSDTLAAGGGLCDPDAVWDLVGAFPSVVRGLARTGLRFDRAGTGGLAYAREGGHHRPRIVHAGGDATGAELIRTLAGAVAASRVSVAEDTMALDVLLDDRGRVAGALLARVADDGTLSRPYQVTSRAVVLATGGMGQAYAATTNPDVATGDGLALALRAGAEVVDVEFVQFHPTALYAAAARPAAAATGAALPLVTEAVRGEGAVLVDVTGRPIMAGVHPMADLAPRDVVSVAIARRLREAPGGVADHVLLDATRLDAATWHERFPTVLALCRAAGIDPIREPVPVSPAAHYACGGVRTDACGRSTVPGLYAVGEAAATGLHGANRLASNSLPEAVLTGERVGRLLGRELPEPPGAPTWPARPAQPGDSSHPAYSVLADPAGRAVLAAAMARDAGVLRDAAGLRRLAVLLADPSAAAAHCAPAGPPATRAAAESANLRLACRAVVHAATLRRESRGCHQRLDHPHPREPWLGHLALTLHRDGGLRHRIQTVASAA